MRRGFTLVEMMIALLLTAIVALIAQGLLAAVLDGASATTRAAPSNEGPLLGRIWLLEACRGLETGTEGTTGFHGDGTAARFSSHLMTADGWTERQEVLIEASGATVKLRARSITATIADSTEWATLDYLFDAGKEGTWMSEWSAPISAPLAIRLRWMRAGVADTLICPIGGRG